MSTPQGHANNLTSAGAACARNVAVAATGVAICLAALGWVIEHRTQLWDALIYGLSFGGNFWPAVASAALSFVVAAWALCTASKLEVGQGVRALIMVTLCAALTYLAAYVALQATFKDYDELTIYARVVVFFLSLLVPVAGFGALCLAAAVFGDLEPQEQADG